MLQVEKHREKYFHREKRYREKSCREICLRVKWYFPHTNRELTTMVLLNERSYLNCKLIIKDFNFHVIVKQRKENNG